MIPNDRWFITWQNATKEQHDAILQVLQNAFSEVDSQTAFNFGSFEVDTNIFELDFACAICRALHIVYERQVEFRVGKLAWEEEWSTEE